MDNLENNDPQGADDVTASGGQSEVETQPAENATEENSASTEAETASEATEAGESTYPWESDDRFKGKSPEEMYNLVREADKYKGELGKKAKVADIIQEKYGIDPESLEQILTQQEQEKQQELLEEDPAAYLQNEVARTQQELALLKEEKALDNFLKEKPEYAPFRDKLMKVAFTAEPNKPYSEIAEEYFGDAIKAGQQSAYEKIEEKTNTQATSSSQAEAQKPNLDELSVEELEKVLPHAGE